MSLSALFIRRPVMTTLVMAAFVIFGIISYTLLPIDSLPAVDYPTITVSASLPGANADTMAAAVATPLERQFTTISGLDSMNSTSALGTCQITLQFNLNRDIDGAAQDVQSAIIAARTYLPASMPTPPTFRKVNPADAPILYIALSSPTLPLYTVDEYAENMIATRISMVSGVAQVQVYGSQVYSPRVQVDPRKLASYGIGIDQVASAIRAGNVNLPTGTLYGPVKAYNIVANGQLYDATQFSTLIVAYKNGSPVRLKDVGRVIDSVQTDKVASWYNNTRAIILAVQRQPGTNTIKIIDSIKEQMPMFKAILPGAVDINVLYDKSISTRRSVDDVKRTLLITIVLVIGVIFLFLGNVSTTIIAGLSLPISIIGTFAAMKVFNFTLNNISLMALTLCVGFVVDDAIVVLENIVRHMEKGEDSFTAALKGSAETGFTIVSMTLSLIAVFIPILFLGGIIGRLFFQFAVTITVAILISGIVSLTLTPMMCSRFLKVSDHKRKTKTDLAFDYLQSLYKESLLFALKHRIQTVGVFIVMLISTIYLMGVVPKGFMPTEDTGQVFGMTQADQGISFEEMVRHQKRLANIVAKDPNIAGFMSSVGAGGPNSATNQGRIFMVLKPRPERPGHTTIDQYIQEMRKKTAAVAGISFYLQNLPTIRIGGQLTKAQYQLTLSGSELTDLYTSAKKLEKEMKKISELQDVNTDMQIRNLQLNVDVDRDKCARLGITMDQVQNALNSAYSSRQVSVIYTPDDQFWVILEVEPQYYQDPSMLHWFFVRSSTNQLVPLYTLAKVSRGAGPLLVNHLGQFPSVTISFNLKPDAALSTAVSQIKEEAAKILPPDITYSFQGSAQAFESATKNLGVLLLISIMVIYIVLGILYESFIHPVTILSGLPSAGLGALITLIIAHMSLDIYSFLGLILLVGLVKKNAIMMVDYAVEKERSENCDCEEAIYEACLTRFRPIMMTTIAAILGSLPIAIGVGEGSEMRQPLGLAIVGGLLVSQVVTLYITPVFYIYLDKLQKTLPKFSILKSKGKATGTT